MYYFVNVVTLNTLPEDKNTCNHQVFILCSIEQSVTDQNTFLLEVLSQRFVSPLFDSYYATMLQGVVNRQSTQR